MTQAFLFPGQGSQCVGMGKSLAENFKVAKHVFDEVDDVLGQHLFKLMVDGPESDLTLTENAQPALLAVSIAALRVLEHEMGQKAKDMASYVLGHSLGEYSALVAAESLDLSTAAVLVKARGLAMQKAVPEGLGAMIALLGLDREKAQEICDDFKGRGVCVIANDNAPGQVVLSGEACLMEEAAQKAKAMGAKKVVPLSVSAPFHSPMMAPAAEAMRDLILGAPFKKPRMGFLSNITVQLESDVDIIKNLLVEQICAPIRFRECAMALQSFGVDATLELGAGKVLSGLVKRIYTPQQYGVHTMEDIKHYVEKK